MLQLPMHRAEFLDLIRTRTVDILLANDSELRSLYETSDLDTAVALLRRDCRLSAVTVGSDGALVRAGYRWCHRRGRRRRWQSWRWRHWLR